MEPCKFTFDDSPVFDGFAHGSSWNGFDNVAVTAAERNRIAQWMARKACDPDAVAQEIVDLMAIEPIKDTDPPLYSLGWGYATLIAERLPLPDNAAGMIAARFAVIVHAWLTPDEWREMLARNAAEPGRLVCHSHDFCDANMAMAEAFESIVGHTPMGSPDADIDSDTGLWNLAWEIAMPALGRQP